MCSFIYICWQCGTAHIRLPHSLQHTHTRLTALCPGQPGWAGTRKVNPIWILLKQETVSGSGISWAICKSAPCSRQITMPAPHRPTNSVKALRHHSTIHCSNRSISPACRAHSSSVWQLDGTDRHTDARQLHRPCSAYCMGGASRTEYYVLNWCVVVKGLSLGFLLCVHILTEGHLFTCRLIYLFFRPAAEIWSIFHCCFLHGNT